MKDQNAEYWEILNEIKCKDGFRGFAMEPFIANGMTMATDSYVIFACPKIIGNALEDQSRKISNIWPSESDLNTPISRQSLNTAFDKVGMIPEEIECNVECSECGGGGEVEWEYGLHTKEMDCPVCDGEGTKPSGKEIKDPNAVLTIRANYFDYKHLSKLKYVCDKLDQDPILIYQRNFKSLFMIGECFFLLICRTKGDENVIRVNLEL